MSDRDRPQPSHEPKELTLQEAREMIAEGARQMDRGQTIEAATFFAEWDAELAALGRALRRRCQ